MKTFLMTLAACSALTALSTPVLADERFEALLLAPVGNIENHGIDYALGYTVAKSGPIQISPLAIADTTNGQTTYHLGAAATVLVFKRMELGLAEVQRTGTLGFSRLGTDVVFGVRF
jgi:hypothetical protein